MNRDVSGSRGLWWVAVLVLLAVAEADAATYHVAPHGDDRWTGQEGRPFRTIGRGVSALAAGDELVVSDGVYAEAVTIWGRDGTEDAPIVIRAADGERPIIDGSHLGALDDPPNGVVLIGRSSWIVFRGFEVRNSPSAGVVMESSRHIRVEGNLVHHCQTYGIRASGTDRSGSSGDIRIEHNHVHRNVLHNAPRKLERGWAQALSVMYTEDAVIRGNTVEQNFGEGIDAILSRHVVIAQNRVHDNYGTNIYLDNAQYVTVDGNFIFNDDARTEYFRSGRPAAGISAANEHYQSSMPLRRLRITNNIVLWCAAAFLYGNWDAGGGLHDTLIANNTFYAARDALLWIEHDAHDTTLVANNIFRQTGGRDYAWVPERGLTFANNAWYGGRGSTIAAGAGDVMKRPGLANAGGGTPQDYRLEPESPLREAGRFLPELETDHWGAPRSRRYSIGAHELD